MISAHLPRSRRTALAHTRAYTSQIAFYVVSMGSCDPAPLSDGSFLDFSDLGSRDSLAASMARNLRSFLDSGLERLVDALGLASVSVPFALFNITQASPNLHNEHCTRASHFT